MNIPVEYQPLEHKWFDGYWACEHANVEFEVWTEYWPSQAEIDMGTDQDEKHSGVVCQDCGKVLEPDEVRALQCP